MKRPSSGPSRVLCRLGAAVVLAVPGLAVLAVLAALGLTAAMLGGPVLVEILGR